MDEARDGQLAGGVEQHLRAQHVGPHERPRVLDAPVHVAFGREVDEALHAARGGADGVPVGDVPAHEAVARVRGQVREVRQVPGVRQRVEVDDGEPGVGAQGVPDEVAPDETAAAGDQESRHVGPFRSRSLSLGPRPG